MYAIHAFSARKRHWHPHDPERANGDDDRQDGRHDRLRDTMPAPTHQRAQPTSATSGVSTSRSGPKSNPKTVTLPAMPPRCKFTFQRRACVIAMAITTPMTTEATVASRGA